MTRNEALEIAKTNHAAHEAKSYQNIWKGGGDFDAEAMFGYRHGWYTVGDFCFSQEHITGEKYDITQGGWAYL